MTIQHIVVDGSNIATEGRSTPSLAQLEGAVQELRRELPDAELTIVVDATFAHRIDPSELPRFEEAALKGRYVYPPAGAIGRGDAFLLRIAERVGGTVLSNDSFQEFHGEHEWLFQPNRLLGGTPVPGIGWIFVPRNPVRGPKSRVAVRDATRARARVEKAIAQATKEVVAPDEAAREEPGQPRRRSRTPAASPQAVNDPLTFISFIAEHHLGGVIDAEVEGFTSHGAVAQFGGVRCYVPLSGLGSPAPRKAREVLQRGEVRTFVITALDPHRRGVELALPDVAVVSGRPSDETVEAEVRMARSDGRRGAQRREAAAPSAAAGRARARVPGLLVEAVSVDTSWPLVPTVPPVRVRKAAEPGATPTRVGPRRRATAAPVPAPRIAAIAAAEPASEKGVGASRAKKAASVKAVGAKAGPPTIAEVTTRKAAATKAPAKKAAATKEPAKKVAAKKAPPAVGTEAAGASASASAPPRKAPATRVAKSVAHR